MESLQHEVENSEKSIIVITDETSSKQRVTLDSVADWAADRYGIGISVRPVDKKLKNVKWEDIIIDIKENNKIGYKIKKGRFTYKLLKDVGLMGKKRHEPNEKYKNLIHLSLELAIGTGRRSATKDRKAIYELRKVLSKLVPLQGDPFLPRNPIDGWKPRFKLTSYLAVEEEYMENYTYNETYDDTKKYK